MDLRGYLTEAYQIYIQCSRTIAAAIALIGIVIFNPFRNASMSNEDASYFH